MATKRFASLDADEIERKKMLINSKETIKSNQKAARLLKAYLKEASMEENFEEFDPVKLNEVLGKFYMNARKQDGDHYKATTFEHTRHALNRYLQGVPFNRKIDIIKDSEFSDANVCFKAALAELKRMGKGSVDHHPIINETDRMKLYESVYMSTGSPEALSNKVQFDIRLYFCRRSQENMHGMSKSTFEVLKDPKTGLKYVSKREDELTKNHRGNDRESTSGVMPEFPGSQYCPVKSFETYTEKLNPLCSSLWQRPKESFSEDDVVWYCNSRLGEKTLAKFMSKLSEKAKLSEVYTNHSIRATGATILTKSMFNASQIMAVTEHKSVQSLTVYQRTDTEEKIAMGHAMGKSLTPQNSTVLSLPPAETYMNMSALPLAESSAALALPPPVNYSVQALPAPRTVIDKCTDIVSVASASGDASNSSTAVAELQGLDISELFSDFPTNSVQAETTISTFQSRQILPAFSGCRIGTINFNFNVSK